MGGLFGNCTDITAEDHVRNVYEEVYDEIIDYSMMVCTYFHILFYQTKISISSVVYIEYDIYQIHISLWLLKMIYFKYAYF